ncbi:hypothetical protein PHISCL_00216 [Aspergillus sclerotialis]|uniref:Uncharacterized protein n=1 Tax=Aspergillus sclerotialis TaxID=2070753 RepID=A0A3A2ZWG5_9EURO|nr:hypothetical protein PHISCL_00216 [Aspergillus sclerotialis]
MADRWRKDHCIEGHDANGPVSCPQDEKANATFPATEEYPQQRALSTRSTPTSTSRAQVFSARDVERLRMSMELVVGQASVSGNGLLGQFLPRNNPPKRSFSAFSKRTFKKLTGEKPISTQTDFNSMGRTVFPRFTPRRESRSDYYCPRPSDRCKFSDRRRDWYRSNVRCGVKWLDGRLKKPELDTIFEQPGLEE